MMEQLPLLDKRTLYNFVLEIKYLLETLIQLLIITISLTFMWDLKSDSNFRNYTAINLTVVNRKYDQYYAKLAASSFFLF